MKDKIIGDLGGGERPAEEAVRSGCLPCVLLPESSHTEHILGHNAQTSQSTNNALFSSPSFIIIYY